MDEPKKDKKPSAPKPPKKTVHVDFIPAEHERVKAAAASVGLPVTSFVRQQALHGKTKGYNMKPLLDHASQLGAVIQSVRKIVDEPNRDRWMYEADLDRIETLLYEIAQQEKDLHEMLMRRLKK